MITSRVYKTTYTSDNYTEGDVCVCCTNCGTQSKSCSFNNSLNIFKGDALKQAQNVAVDAGWYVKTGWVAFCPKCNQEDSFLRDILGED